MPREYRYGVDGAGIPPLAELAPGDRYQAWGGEWYVVARCKLCGAQFSYRGGQRGRVPEYDGEECREVAARVAALDHAMTAWVRAQLRSPDGKARVGQLKRRLLRLVMSALNV